MKATVIVSKESLKKMLESEDRRYVEKVVGRALVAIFKNQTEDEKAINATDVNNGIGFTGADARSGSLTAKSYLKKQKLEDWQLEKWLKLQKDGYPRICKYHGQLNAVAVKNKSVGVQ